MSPLSTVRRFTPAASTTGWCSLATVFWCRLRCRQAAEEPPPLGAAHLRATGKRAFPPLGSDFAFYHPAGDAGIGGVRVVQWPPQVGRTLCSAPLTCQLPGSRILKGQPPISVATPRHLALTVTGHRCSWALLPAAFADFSEMVLCCSRAQLCPCQKPPGSPAPTSEPAPLVQRSDCRPSAPRAGPSSEVTFAGQLPPSKPLAVRPSPLDGRTIRLVETAERDLDCSWSCCQMIFYHPVALVAQLLSSWTVDVIPETAVSACPPHVSALVAPMPRSPEVTVAQARQPPKRVSRGSLKLNGPVAADSLEEDVLKVLLDVSRQRALRATTFVPTVMPSAHSATVLHRCSP